MKRVNCGCYLPLQVEPDAFVSPAHEALSASGGTPAFWAAGWYGGGDRPRAVTSGYMPTCRVSSHNRIAGSERVCS